MRCADFTPTPGSRRSASISPCSAGSLIAVGRVEQAKQWLKRALEIDPDDSILLYNVACKYATLGDVETALAHLEEAVDNGMVSLGWMRNDTDLDNVRDHPRFARLVRRLESMATPHDPAQGGGA